MIVKTNVVIKNELCNDIGAYDLYRSICLKFSYCKIFSRTNIKFHPAPISNITPHQYQMLRRTNIKIVSVCAIQKSINNKTNIVCAVV